MFEKTDTLRRLNDKIANGTASEDERSYYEFCIRTSCIDTETLLRIIETDETSKGS